MSDLTFVQGDTSPPVKGTLRKDDGSVLVLTDVDEVRFQMRKPDDRYYTVDADAEILDPDAGTVQYSWTTNDLSIPGEYISQWELTFNDGQVQTTRPANTITVERQ